jgi:flagellar basal-body rod protein FlgB
MDSRPLELLRHAMQAYALRSRALSANVANLDTPDYRRLTVDFEASLQRAHRHADGTSAALPDARMRTEDSPALLEDELMELADTQMRTQLATRALKEHFGLMRTGITGRTA